MSRLSRAMVALPLWLSLWLTLAGADRGCFFVDPICGDLDEAACIEDDNCRPVYIESYRDDLNCGAEDTRCIGGEPEFDRCEQKPDCAGLGEEACVSEAACQAVYGYPDDAWMLNGYDQPRCVPGARCIVPPDAFLECLDADADPCLGLDEQACWQRPVCEAIYGSSFCEDGMCTDDESFQTCQLRVDACRTADDCYNLIGDWDMPNCPGFHFTCEAGQCVQHCEQVGCLSNADCATGEFCDIWCDGEYCEGVCVAEQTGCQADSDCAAGEFCEVRCGNGWCEGVCVLEQTGCLSDADCAVGESCLFMPCDCAPGDDCNCLGSGICVPDQTGCLSDADCAAGETCLLTPCECNPGEECDCLGSGVCVPAEPECASDADCPAGFYCQFTDWCDDGWCGGGTCQQAQMGCTDDSQCAAGETCTIRCGNGWCEGVCEPPAAECYVDADCQEGRFCEPLPNVDCMPGQGCPGACVPGVWTFNEPVQCGGNPWEQDALENPERYYECMVDCGPDMDCGNGFEELCRVRVFFLNQGILVHDLRDVQVYDEVCEACSCPRGDIIYALVDPADASRMADFGFAPY